MPVVSVTERGHAQPCHGHAIDDPDRHAGESHGDSRRRRAERAAGEPPDVGTHHQAAGDAREPDDSGRGQVNPGGNENESLPGRQKEQGQGGLHQVQQVARGGEAIRHGGEHQNRHAVEQERRPQPLRAVPSAAGAGPLTIWASR